MGGVVWGFLGSGVFFLVLKKQGNYVKTYISIAIDCKIREKIRSTKQDDKNTAITHMAFCRLAVIVYGMYY